LGHTDQLQLFAVYFDIYTVILLKHLHQKSRSTVD